MVININILSVILYGVNRSKYTFVFTGRYTLGSSCADPDQTHVHARNCQYLPRPGLVDRGQNAITESGYGRADVLNITQLYPLHKL